MRTSRQRATQQTRQTLDQQRRGGGAAGFLAHNVEKRVEKLEKREELYNVYVSPVSYSFRDAREIEQYV